MATAKRVNLQDLELGQTPKTIVADTNAVSSKNFGVLHAVTDCVFTSLADEMIEAGSMTGVTLKAGDRYFGVITALQLSSGTLICYNR